MLLLPVLLVDLEPDSTGRVRPGARVAAELIGAVAVLAAAAIFARFVDRRSFTSLGFRARGMVTDLVGGLLLGGALIGIAVGAAWVAGWAELPPARVSWPVLAPLGAAMFLNSVTQEVLVRGYVLQTMERYSGVVAAVLGSAAFFTALHAGALVEGGLLPGINLFLAGVLLGLAYVARRNLWLPIALHFSWNFVQGPLLGIAVTGQRLDAGWRLVRLEGPTLVTGGDFGLEGGLLGTVATSMGVGLLAWIGGRRGWPVDDSGGGVAR